MNVCIHIEGVMWVEHFYLYRKIRKAKPGEDFPHLKIAC